MIDLQNVNIKSYSFNHSHMFIDTTAAVFGPYLCFTYYNLISNGVACLVVINICMVYSYIVPCLSEL